MYSDELGTVLDRLHRDELVHLATDILKRPEARVAAMSDNDLREYCSKRVRRAAGHSASAPVRGHHGLPYDKIVTRVARVFSVPVEEGDDVATIERNIITGVLSQLDDDAWTELQAQVVSEAASSSAQELLRKLSKPEFISLVIKLASSPKPFGPTVIGGSLVVGPMMSTIASVVGWNTLQALLLTALLKIVGTTAALKAALGIGFWGGAMKVAAFAGPIGVAIGVGLTLHQIAGPAMRHTAPAVMFIAVKRMQYEIS